MLKFAAITVLLCATLISAQLDPYEVCIDQEDGTMIGIGAEETCTGYFYCEGEIGYEEDCAVVSGAEFQFNYETGQCDYDDVVLCDVGGGVDPDPTSEPEPEPETDPPATQTTQPPVTTTADPSVPDIECPTDRPGQILFFASSNCTEYFICSNGVRMRMSCMEGFTWNDIENQCDYPIFSRCSVSLVFYKLGGCEDFHTRWNNFSKILFNSQISWMTA